MHTRTEGIFTEGKEAIIAIRKLNVFIKGSDDRLEGLKASQKYLQLPVMSAKVDADTRVAYVSKLLVRSILNKPAMKAYFEKRSMNPSKKVEEKMRYSLK